MILEIVAGTPLVCWADSFFRMHELLDALTEHLDVEFRDLISNLLFFYPKVDLEHFVRVVLAKKPGLTAASIESVRAAETSDHELRSLRNQAEYVHYSQMARLKSEFEIEEDFLKIGYTEAKLNSWRDLTTHGMGDRESTDEARPRGTGRANAAPLNRTLTGSSLAPEDSR